MTWYTASAIMLFEYKDGVQNDYSIWENQYLIDASSDEKAYQKAKLYAKDSEGDADGTLTLNGRPAILKFVGIRKLITVTNLNSKEDIPGDGAEVAYSKYSVKTKKDLEKLINGKSVNVSLYEE